MKKTILALSVLGLVFASCKKDKQDQSITPTKENLTGTYKITAMTVGSNGVSMDVFSQQDACSKDDIYHLNADNSYAIEDAGIVCSPDDNSAGTWSLESSTTINVDGEVGAIKSWNGKTLVVEITDSSSGTTATYSTTYVIQ